MPSVATSAEEAFKLRGMEYVGSIERHPSCGKVLGGCFFIISLHEKEIVAVMLQIKQLILYVCAPQCNRSRHHPIALICKYTIYK